MSDKKRGAAKAGEGIDAMSMIATMTAGPALLACMGSKGERAVQLMAMASIQEGFAQELLAPIGYADGDTVAFEMPIRTWRADLVVFHQDGSATVVEIKDGEAGLQSVLAGIGQVGLYATVLGMSGGVKRVNRALLWTGGSAVIEHSALIAESCRQAGVVPVYMPTVRDLLKQRLADAVMRTAQAIRVAQEGSV